MEGNFNDNPAAGGSENGNPQHQHGHNLRVRDRPQRNINNDIGANAESEEDLSSDDDEFNDDDHAAAVAAAAAAQPAAGGGSGSGGGNSTVKKKKTGGARKKKSDYNPESDGPPVPPNACVKEIPVGSVLKLSEVKGAAKQNTDGKSKLQINSDRADKWAQQIRELQPLYTELHADSKSAEADWKEYVRRCKMYEEYLKQKNETQRAECLEMKSKFDAAKYQNESLKQQLMNTKQLKKGELDAKDSVIAMQKGQIKALNDTIADFRDIEVTQAKSTIAVQTTRAKASSVQEVKDISKRKRNESAKQKANMVQSSHHQMRMSGGGGGGMMNGMMMGGDMGGDMGGGMGGGMFSQHYLPSQHHVHHQNGNQQFDFMQPGNGSYIPPQHQNDTSSYGGSIFGMVQNGNHGQRRRRGVSRGQYGGHPGGDDVLPQQIGVPSGNRAGGQQNDASSVAESTFIDSLADNLR